MEEKNFEELYLKIRARENRIYSNEEVVNLPDINPAHLHYREWLIRKASYESLKNYLLKKDKPLHILDLGCGNGWMTNRLSELKQSIVTGIDINKAELIQAQQVFSKNANINFIYGDIFSTIFDTAKKFDCINLSASIQYFYDLKKLINRLLGLLNTNGEIHITCTHFYNSKNVVQAKRTSEKYYHEMGFDEMIPFYHHHTLSELTGFNFEVLNRSWMDKLQERVFEKKENYFPWIVIKHWG